MKKLAELFNQEYQIAQLSINLRHYKEDIHAVISCIGTLVSNLQNVKDYKIIFHESDLQELEQTSIFALIA